MKLQLYYPVKPVHINQKFGEIANLQYYKDHGLTFIGHNGIDFQAYHGQPVYATHDGMAYYEVDNAQGDGFVIRTNQAFDYNNEQVYFKTIYWHLCSANDPKFKPLLPTDGNGYLVKAGQIIGYADSTGLSTGDHLHFGLKPQLNGEPNGSWYNIEQNNGYLGAIDPNPYFNGLFAQDLGVKYQFLTDFGMYSLKFYDIYQLQKMLVSMGYGNFSPTGFFGGKTQEAVQKYQTAKDISPTGFVGPLTRASLNA